MDAKSEVQVDSSVSERKDPEWKYSCFLNEKDFNSLQNGNILVYYMNRNSTVSKMEIFSFTT